MRSTAKRFLVVAMAMAMVVALPGVALAHHPEISATPDCMLDDGSWYLDYEASAWAGTTYNPNPTDPERTHPTVDIYVNGVLVDTGAFNPGNGFMFNGTYLVPAGITQVVVTAEARAGVPWGNGHLPQAGEERSTDVIDKPDELCFEPPGTGTPGYWHKIERWEYWEIAGVTVGGVYYTAAQAVEIINMPVKGDKTLTMFPALVAAMNNVAIGNPSFCIAATIAAADAWMAANPPENGVKANSDAWDVGGPLASMLDQYNNGYLCAPHRD